MHIFLQAVVSYEFCFALKIDVTWQELYRSIYYSQPNVEETARAGKSDLYYWIFYVAVGLSRKSKIVYYLDCSAWYCLTAAYENNVIIDVFPALTVGNIVGEQCMKKNSISPPYEHEISGSCNMLFKILPTNGIMHLQDLV